MYRKPQHHSLTIVRHFPHALSEAAVNHVRVHGCIGRGVRVSILLHCQRFLPERIEPTGSTEHNYHFKRTP